MTVNDIWKYETSTNTWISFQYVAEGPASRKSASLWVVNTTLWIYGGNTAGYPGDTSGKNFNDLWSFNLETGEWTIIMGNGTGSQNEFAIYSTGVFDYNSR